MKFGGRNKSIVDFLFIFALFGVFAVSALFVVVFGSKIYRRTVSDMQDNFQKRTALSYVTEKVRSHDYNGGIDVENMIEEGARGDKYSVLKLSQMENGRKYVTYLFECDGYLKEFTACEDYDFDYKNGTNILPVREFNIIKKSDSLFEFEIVDDNQEWTRFYVTLYSATDGEAEYE